MIFQHFDVQVRARRKITLLAQISVVLKVGALVGLLCVLLSPSPCIALSFLNDMCCQMFVYVSSGCAAKGPPLRGSNKQCVSPLMHAIQLIFNYVQTITLNLYSVESTKCDF